MSRILCFGGDVETDINPGIETEDVGDVAAAQRS